MENCYECIYNNRPPYMEPCASCIVKRNFKSEEVNMDIKVNRKPVDKIAEVDKKIGLFRGERISRERLLSDIDSIYTGQAQGEVESIEIIVDSEQTSFHHYEQLTSKAYTTIKLTPDQLREINKAVESK